jgi:hypothetical protein
MTIRLASIAFDCADALVVGTFWSKAFGRPLDPGADSGFAAIGFAARRTLEGWRPVERAENPTWLFARVPEPKLVKNRVHPDLVADDVEAEISRLVELGATRVADHEEYGYRWTLLTDPEGNEFDLAQAL